MSCLNIGKHYFPVVKFLGMICQGTRLWKFEIYHGRLDSCSIVHFRLHLELFQVSVCGQRATEDAVLLNAIHSLSFFSFKNLKLSG